MTPKIIIISLALLLIGTVAGNKANAATPQISNIIPNSGPASGGTEVTIIGKNFVQGMEVFFGGIAATVVTFRSPSGVDCIVPGNIVSENTEPDKVGLVDVTISTPDGQTDTKSDGFQYTIVATPVIIPPLLPNEGHISGGTMVTISGYNFSNGVTVRFDDMDATEVTVVSSKKITCKTPEHEKAFVDVVVTNPDEQADTCEQCYSYFSGCPSSEREALIKLYNDTDGENWHDNSNWLGDPGTECSWKGIACNEDRTHVTEICLENNRLEGDIPASVGNLSELQILSLQTNYLSGPVPEEILNLTNLTDKQSDFRGNCLWTKDDASRSFLSSKQVGEEWEGSQRNCCVSENLTLRVSSVQTGIGVTGENLEIKLIGTGFDETTSAVVFQKNESGGQIGDGKNITDMSLVRETELHLTLSDISEAGSYSLRISGESQNCELSDAIVFEASADVEKQRDKKAIIIAGSGPYPGNALWKATLTCANKAYQTLITQGYTDDTIYYLNPETDIDITGDGITDVDGDATLDNLDKAIRSWAEEADELLIYMTGHGGDATFSLNTATTMQVLSAEELDGWLDTFQGTRGENIIFIYDSAMSGSFFPLMAPPMEKDRIFISSSSANERAWFLEDGKFSFSYFLWETLRVTGNIYSAFSAGKEMMKLDQTAILDADGNSVGNEDTDTSLVENRTVGLGRTSRTDLPHIGNISEEQTLECGENTVTIWVSNITSLNPIQRVWAVIIPPEISGDLSDPVTEMPSVNLTDEDKDGIYDGTYEADYDSFDKTGSYTIAVYVKDEKGDQSSPLQTAVIKDCKGEISGDDTVDLKDAIIALKLLAGDMTSLTIRSDYLELNMEIGGDGKIDLADVIFILRKLAGNL